MAVTYADIEAAYQQAVSSSECPIAGVASGAWLNAHKPRTHTTAYLPNRQYVIVAGQRPQLLLEDV